jgi:signal transduction histidine kinase
MTLPLHLAPMRARLTQVLSWLLELLEAEAVSLRVRDAETQSLVLSVSSGDAEEALAAHLVNTECGVEIVQLDVHEALGKKGMASLLGLPVPGGGPSLGTLWVAIRERRPFNEREVRRASQFRDVVAAHLANARLDAALRQKIEELEGESELRERFISMLTHDLGTPLAAARSNAAQLAAAAQPRAVRVLGEAIGHSVAEAQRMVSDLLDAQRIRAGMRLPMALADCDLVALVRDALEGMHAIYGDRFLLRGARSVRGIWNGDQLRRAIWNLCENAVKFGLEEAAVEIEVNPMAEGAELKVRNQGPPIPPDELQRMFAPFSAQRSTLQRHPRGWGIGLTLIWGCAEAHGGRVTVVSDAESGTTFRLLLPYDGRPYAE